MKDREVIGDIRANGLLVVVEEGWGPHFILTDANGGHVVAEFSFVDPCAGGELGQQVADFMKAPNEDQPGYTNWEVAIVAHNRVNNLAPNRDSSFYLLTSSRLATQPDIYRGCLPVDLPVPDYAQNS